MSRPSRAASRNASQKIQGWAAEERQPDQLDQEPTGRKQQMLAAAIAAAPTAFGRAGKQLLQQQMSAQMQHSAIKRERSPVPDPMQRDSKRRNVVGGPGAAVMPKLEPKVEPMSDHPHRSGSGSHPQSPPRGPPPSGAYGGFRPPQARQLPPLGPDDVAMVCDQLTSVRGRATLEGAARRRFTVFLGSADLVQGHGPRVVAALLELTVDKTAEMRATALTALGRLLEQLKRTKMPQRQGWRKAILNRLAPALSDEDHRVRKQGLSVLSVLSDSAAVDARVAHSVQASVLLDDTDPRVRAEAFRALLHINEMEDAAGKLPLAAYTKARDALADDDESVRSAALDLICSFGVSSPSVQISRAIRPDTDESEPTETRLVDDAFVTICDMVTDLSIQIRAQASRLLGRLSGVAEDILTQTFDKKVMSHLRRKLTEHEYQRRGASMKKGHLHAAGDLDVENMSLMSSGACGAFVHGLEDEFCEVREAAIESICNLCRESDALANKALDFMADMFSDEIDSVRLMAINGMSEFGSKVTFYKQQIDVMLGMLEDNSVPIRESMHNLLATIKIASFESVAETVHTLVANAKKYPMDFESIWRCFKGVGKTNPVFAEFMVEPLLKVGVHFATAEPNVDDAIYVGIVIFLSAAGKENPRILTLLPDFFPRHHRYLKDKYGGLVADLDFMRSCTFSNDPFHTSLSLAAPARTAATTPTAADGQGAEAEGRGCISEQLEGTVKRIHAAAAAVVHRNFRQIAQELKACGSQLAKIGRYQSRAQKGIVQMHTQFTVWLQHYCGALHQLSIGKAILDKNGGQHELLYRIEATNPTAAESLRPTLLVLRALCHAQVLIIQCQCTAVTPAEVELSSTLFVQRVDKLASLDLDENSALAKFVDALEASCEIIRGADAGTVQRAMMMLHAMLVGTPIPVPTPAGGLSLPATQAVILSPQPSNKQRVFQKGLPLALPLSVRIRQLQDRSRLRIQVRYPDGRCLLMTPASSHHRATGANESIVDTTCFVSNDAVASGAFRITISVGVVGPIDVPRDPILSDVTAAAQNGSIRFFSISKPLHLFVWPKEPKRVM